VTISRNAMSKQMSTSGKSKKSKITDEEQAKIEFDTMTQNLNLSPKEKAAKKKQEQAMKMKDKKMPKYQRGMMVAAEMPESGPRKKKKPVPRAPYDDSGVNVGGGPKGGPKPSPKGTGGVMAGPNPTTGGPMPPSKRRAPMAKGRDRASKMPMMNKGGKVRGCGMAKQGVRKAKMVRMKGS
jgi:hypothetical protein